MTIIKGWPRVPQQFSSKAGAQISKQALGGLLILALHEAMSTLLCARGGAALPPWRLNIDEFMPNGHPPSVLASDSPSSTTPSFLL